MAALFWDANGRYGKEEAISLLLIGGIIQKKNIDALTRSLGPSFVSLMKYWIQVRRLPQPIHGTAELAQAMMQRKVPPIRWKGAGRLVATRRRAGGGPWPSGNLPLPWHHGESK